jgi:murein DD-endopeptidase MepM/ murein hydrolase activator NlpD
MELKSQTLENPNTSPIHTLGTIEKDKLKTIHLSSFNPIWVKDLKLLLPCENVKLSKKSSRLPNAPRKYRNGTHRGIDFFANWGTNIRAVAPGVVIRSDQHYKEYPSDFREKMLQSCEIVGHTPSDIFNNVLLGKSIIIDHGFNLIPGFRTISIYAHLSDIYENITCGTKVEQGQLIGKTGNTGTRPSTLGTKKEAHLHWELILQKNNEEIYLGKGMAYDPLYKMLHGIFYN